MRRIRKVLRYYHNPRRLALLACSAVLVLGLGSVKGMSYMDTRSRQARYEPEGESLQEIASGLDALRQGSKSPTNNGLQEEQDQPENSSSTDIEKISSFDNKITHSGQITSGTQIGYDAAKGTKTYYGGDLVFSSASIIYDKGRASESEPTDHIFYVSTPDEQIVQEPHHPPHDTSPYGFLSLAAGNTSSTTFKMLVTMNDDTPTGTYTLHLTAVRQDQNSDVWQYDGFVTVEVIDSNAENTSPTEN